MWVALKVVGCNFINIRNCSWCRCLQFAVPQQRLCPHLENSKTFSHWGKRSREKLLEGLALKIDDTFFTLVSFSFLNEHVLKCYWGSNWLKQNSEEVKFHSAFLKLKLSPDLFLLNPRERIMKAGRKSQGVNCKFSVSLATSLRNRMNCVGNVTCLIIGSRVQRTRSSVLNGTIMITLPLNF